VLIFTRYGSSIPISKALDMYGDVLIAYKMNGVDIPRDHGYPLRVIVPGIVGARNVKWLSKIKASEFESPSFWQQNDYKGFSPSVDYSNVDYKNSHAIQELPVQSQSKNSTLTPQVCLPKKNQTFNTSDETILVKGF
jgi:sulfite oxidase